MNPWRTTFLLLTMLAALLVSATPGLSQDECMDLDHDGVRSNADFWLLADYMFNDGPAPDPLWAADIDKVAGITVSDFQSAVFAYFVGFPWPWPVCSIESDTFPAMILDTTIFRNTVIPVSASQHVVELWHHSSGFLTGLSIPFSYDCSTSVVALDSIVPRNHPYFLRVEIDSVNPKGLFLYSRIFEWEESRTLHMADLYFSIESPDPNNEQRILIDTTSYPPSHTAVAVEQWGHYIQPNGRPHMYGIVGTADRPSASCCMGLTGDVNASGSRDLSDLTALVNSLFITYEPVACPEAANTSGDSNCQINLTDLFRLINSLFVDFQPTADCDTFDNFICGGQ